MMEGPLLEGKFGTEPSIVDAGEVTDDGEGEGRGCEWFSGSNSHVSLLHTLLSQPLLCRISPSVTNLPLLLLSRPKYPP